MRVESFTADFSNTYGGAQSGLEFWRLLTCNFDRASAFNIIVLVEITRNMHQAKNIQDTLLKIASLDRIHQQYYKAAMASKIRSL